MNKPVLLLLDGNSLINRAFYGLFGRQQLTAPDGTPTGALFAFLNMFLRYLTQISPTHIAVAFDRKEPTFRHDLFDNYKGTRKPMPDELAVQLPILKEILDGMGVCRIEKAGYEADDLLGTLAEIGKRQEAHVYIVSGDKDSFQLIDDQVTIIWPVTRKGQSELEIYDRQAIINRYELSPEQFVDFKAIMGDPSDNIPGVKGIGEKGALQLLKQYPTLDALYASLDELKPAQANKLEASREIAFLSRELATICRQVPVNQNLDDFKRHEANPEKLSDLLSQLGLKQLMSRLDLEQKDKKPQEDPPEPSEIELITTDRLRERLDSHKTEMIACWLTEVEQMLLMPEDDKVYLIGRESIKDAWRILSDSQVRIAVCDYKQMIQTYELEPLCLPAHDVLLAAHLLNQIDGRPELTRLYQTITGQTLIIDSETADKQYQEQDLFGEAGSLVSSDTGNKNDQIQPSAQQPDLTVVSTASLLQLRAVYKIAWQQTTAIRDRKIEQLTYEIEMPLAAILAEMETRGFAVDLEKLSQLGDLMEKRLDELQSGVFEMTGHDFNLSSPKQLSEVLYQELGLKPGKKRTGGAFSTDFSELERLQGDHPVIELIIEHRQTAKLRSTYIEGLKKVINPDDQRVHTTFNQMLTTTGRLSSSEPNLQNIPIRMEAGQKIREAFIAAPGYILLDADYSQIELRLLAHLSDDPAMIDAFVHEADIHTQTACSIFNCAADEVTPEKRAVAKTMNFSIVYGISDFGLARDLGVPIKVAHQYIKEYDEQYPRVRAWLNEQVKRAHEQTYVETLFGRRRYLHELKSPNRNLRQFGERAAMNAPVQGTAADMIKIAMVKVDQALKENNLESRLILQVHDELIVEAPAAEADKAALILKTEMESAMTLKVPLKADVMRGKSWAACK